VVAHSGLHSVQSLDMPVIFEHDYPHNRFLQYALNPQWGYSIMLGVRVLENLWYYTQCHISTLVLIQSRLFSSPSFSNLDFDIQTRTERYRYCRLVEVYILLELTEMGRCGSGRGWIYTVVCYGSLQNVFSYCICSGVRMIYRYSSMAMSFICYYGGE